MRKTIGRDLPNGDYIEITAESDDSGTPSPGFAITLSGWERSGTWSARAVRRNRGDDAMSFGGCGHDTILEVAPELAPLVVAHCAAPDGTPMHAEANGWYFYSGQSAAYEREHYGEKYAARHGTDHERAARALHVDPAFLPTGLSQDGFHQYVLSLADTWADQAQAARDALAAMVDGQGCVGA